MTSFLHRARSRLSRDRGGALLAAAVVGVGVWVVMSPFGVTERPPITDLPFHAANASILRHHADPEFHFAEQFVVRPLEAPYFLMYLVGALAACLVPVTTAAKAMTIAMLALLPAGLAVLFHGMKKSPLWGALGLGLVWNTLSHWGFASFLGALGLFAMALGFGLLVLDAPTGGRRLGLAVSLVAVLFAHVYRFPFAVAGLAVAAIVLGRERGRWRSLVVPALPAVALFGVWLFARSHVFAPALGGIAPDFSRVREIGDHVFGGFRGDVGAAERRIGIAFAASVAVAAVAAAVLRRRETTGSVDGAAQIRWHRRSAVVSGVVVLALLGAYLTLPLMAKSWFFVYPREATAAVLVALSLVGDLPRSPAWRALLLALVLGPAVAMTRLVTAEWRRFDAATEDFRAIVADVPRAPKLFYLVFDHGDTNRSTTPWIHLPAWIQAEKGGWLYFHFVRWGLYPIRYDFAGVVPPTLPHMLEWEPQNFRVLDHGPWFDTFLVRHSMDPSALFVDDPTIRLVARRGKWWLYRRTP